MPTFVRQLDGSPHDDDNCGPASVASALRWSTEHDVAPSPSSVRKGIGDFEGGTNPADLETGWEAFRGRAKARGWDLSTMRYRQSEDVEKLIEALRNGHAATLAVLYAEVPLRLSGDPKFRGPEDFHSVFVAAIRERPGRTEVKVFDPLCDGRRAGIPGPGPVWWPLSVMRKAAAGYAGPGTATYNVVRRSKRIAPELPCDPKVVAEYEARIDELDASVARLEDALATSTTALNAIVGAASQAVAIAEDALASIAGDEIVSKADGERGARRGLVR